MFTEEELNKLKALTESNEDFAYFIKRFKEEERSNLSKIYHEIKNPITLINSTVQLIESSHSDIKGIDYWNTLVEDIASLKNLLEDLSSFNNSDRLYKDMINVHKIIEELCASFKPIAVKREIILNFNQNNSNLNLWCDKIKLKQCILNIVKNAFEAVNNKTGIISIHTEQLQSNIHITISNNGSPIPPDIIDEIFTPFITFKSGGTGLGLSITKKIIESHGGILSVKSDNELTSFIITLPISTK